MRRLRSAIIEHGRATEWLTSCVLLGFALTLALPGDTLSGEGFRAFRALGLDEATISTPLALLATARIAALYINGSWHRSPALRVAGAMFGAGVLSTLGVAFGWVYLETIFLAWRQTETWSGFAVMFASKPGASTGAATYTILALFDMLAAYRSGADLKMAKRYPGAR